MSLRIAFLFIGIIMLLPTYAHVRGHHHSHKRVWLHHAHHMRHYAVAQRTEPTQVGGIVTVASAAGPITVAAHVATRFQALIADLVSAGFRGPVRCYARGGHVSHSLHYSGEACDFAQSGRGRTSSVMYHASAMISRQGFRDGCSFHDCGHVDTGLVMHYATRVHHHRRVRYARG